MQRVLLSLLVIGLLAAASASYAAGPADVERVTAGELKARIDGGARIVLLDVRSRGAYDASDVKIKGAVRIPTDELPERLWELPFGAQIATYCT